MSLNIINDETFSKEVLEYNGNVLVDFWAPWCGPCRQLMPTLEEFAKENNAVKVCKINVDENQDVAGQMGIRGIPALILFSGGKKVSMHVGYVSKDGLVKWVEENIKDLS